MPGPPRAARRLCHGVDVPEVTVNGVRLSFDVRGEGDPVVLVCGTGQPAFSWDLGVAPGLLDAGHRVVTFDNRGVAPSDCPPGPYTVGQLAADAAGLIEHLGFGPCFVAGHSLGGMITQELALARPDLVRAAVPMGTVGRTTALLHAWVSAQLELALSGVVLPPAFAAVTSALQIVGRARQLDDGFIGPFVELMAAAPAWEGDGPEGQWAADLAYDDRLGALAGVVVPCLVVGFEHDLITPTALGREVAGAIPGARYAEVPGCGHLGPIEDPAAVVAIMAAFFAAH